MAVTIEEKLAEVRRSLERAANALQPDHKARSPLWDVVIAVGYLHDAVRDLSLETLDRVYPDAEDT